ncbi:MULTISPECIES: DDE-type integrase/transposase/recombinase [Agrobacterium]|uniref:Transposase family protein n=1 Tax=Agrobacterium tumefaciens TaxID=358 RepID=A0AAE6EDG9_AGRTU|nr:MULTISPECIES: DDE-type integrase/transposase/recombinase [Agrobacterium]QCL72267.1 transposase family protein [Agrobacterium tumefaciens]QCL77838.1 transposase family protein [Agrobacterium tumefaciens]CUX21727.1 putative Integrase family protein [Agrobacterium sp. NCPPB 925]
MSYSHPLPTRTHTHSLVSLGRTDRYREGSRNYIPVFSDSLTTTFAHEEDLDRTMVLSRREVWERLRTGKAEVSYYHHSIPIQRTLAVHGDKTLNSFDPKVQHEARLRQGLIAKYDAACRDRKKQLPFSTSLQSDLDSWWKELHGVDETQKNGRRRRTGQAIAEVTNAPSWKTFKRDYDKYLASGRNPVVFVPLHHGPGSRTVIPCRASEVFHQKMAREYLSRLSPKPAQVHTAYLAELDLENDTRRAAGDPELLTFSITKTKNAIGRFDEFEVMASREGEEAALKHFRDVKGSFDIERPGAHVEIDEWKGDLITLLVKTGVWAHLPDVFIDALPKTLRVCVTVAIDVATRYVLGLKITPNPSAEAIAGVLRMAMVDKTDLSRMVGAETDWSACVKPDLASMDNGAAMVSDHFITGAQSIGVTVVRQPAGDPARRPFIERLFGIVGPLITHFLDGRTFASVEEKGDYDAKAHASVFMDEFARIIIFAVCDIYHRKRHGGLGGNTPHNEWVEASGSIDIKYPPSRLRMIAAFGYLTTATIQKDGIVVYGVTYRDERLNALRRRIGQKPIDVMADPMYARHVLVKAKDEDTYFAVENALGLDDTVSFHEWLAVLKQERDEIAEKTKEDLKVMYAGIRRMRRTGEAATARANLGARIPTAEDMEDLNRKVVRGWEANCEAEEVMEPMPDAVPTGALLLDREVPKPAKPELTPASDQAVVKAVATSRSKFDEQEDD